MDSQLLDRSDEARDLAETALYANRRREYDGYAFVTQPFPWGSQWCWGFEFTATKFRLHKPLVKIRSLLYNVCTGGDSLTETMYSEVSKSTGKWGVCVDVDWSSFPTSGGSLTTVSSLVAMKQPPGGEGRYGSIERIPVAWFDGTILLWDMIHTIYHPVIWA